MNEAHFAALVMPITGDILRTAAVLVGSDNAEDAMQEVIVRAWQSISTLREESSIRAWLLRITVHVCLDWQRGRFGTVQRLSTSLPSSDEPTYDQRAVLEVGPGSVEHALSIDLRQAINALEVGLRTVIILRYYVGLDATEIGTMLDVSPSTIRTRLSRALTILRDALDLREVSTMEHVPRGEPNE